MTGKSQEDIEGPQARICALENKDRLPEPGDGAPPFHLGCSISGAHCEKRRSEKAICKLLDVRLGGKKQEHRKL